MSDPDVWYFEDCEVGRVFDCGSHTVTADAITEFAEAFDPQPFHLDEAAAVESPFGGLVASGLHTAAVCHRLLVQEVLSHFARGAGRGADDLRWHRPVRPGDTVSLVAEIVDKRADAGLDGFGKVALDLTATVDDEPAMTMTLLVMVERRDP